MKAQEVKVNETQVEAMRKLETSWVAEPMIHKRTLSALESRGLVKMKQDKSGMVSAKLLKLGEKVLSLHE